MDRKQPSADRLTPDSVRSGRRQAQAVTGTGDDGSESVSEISISRGVAAVGGDSPSITSHSRASSVTSTSAENVSASYEPKVGVANKFLPVTRYLF
jgi:hypothetical protein